MLGDEVGVTSSSRLRLASISRPSGVTLRMEMKGRGLLFTKVALPSMREAPASSSAVARPPKVVAPASAAASAPARAPHPTRWGGGELIKSYVREAEHRRAACRFVRSSGPTPRPPPRRQFHAASSRQGRVTSTRDGDERKDEARPAAVVAAPTSYGNNAPEAEDVAASLVLQGFFTSARVHRARKLSLGPTMAPAVTSVVAAAQNVKPAFTFTRRKLQMESVGLHAASATPHSTVGSMGPSGPAMLTSPHLGPRPKASNLAAKLDAILRSSPWMRRNVVVQHQGQGRTFRRFFKTPSTRPLAVSRSSSSMPPPANHSHPGSGHVSSSGTGGAGPKVARASGDVRRHPQRNNGYGTYEDDPSELEKRVLIVFRRFVRLWRERKRRSEEAALSIVKGGNVHQSSGLNAVNASNGGRPDNKMRREIDAQSSNVVSILSRRMIGEVPALKFFDEGESHDADHHPTGPWTTPSSPLATAKKSEAAADAAGRIKPLPPTLGELMAASSLDSSGGRTPSSRQATPKGVCYTMDAAGCRAIKMQAGTTLRQGEAGKALNRQSRFKQSEGLTVERATSKSLQRRMLRRVKAKRQVIGRCGEAFSRSQQELTKKLGAQLALHQAEGERMFDKRLALMLSDDAQLAPHTAAKELALTRLRFKKMNLLASCQTLAVLGEALNHVELAGETSGLEISSGELHFLELFRCAVEGDHALTPLLADGIRGQFVAGQMQKPLVADLLEVLERSVRAEN